MKEIVTPVHITRQTASIEIRRTIVMHISSILLGFLLARTTAFSTFLPFGTALCAGVRKEYAPSALIGVILGSISGINGVPGII